MEDATQTHRPVYIETFAYPSVDELPPWPVLYNDGEARCPFALPSSHSRKEVTANAWRTLRVEMDEVQAINWFANPTARIASSIETGDMQQERREHVVSSAGMIVGSPECEDGDALLRRGGVRSAHLKRPDASLASGLVGPVSSLRTTSTAINTDPNTTMINGSKPSGPRTMIVDPRFEALIRRPTFTPGSPVVATGTKTQSNTLAPVTAPVQVAVAASRSAVRDFMAVRGARGANIRRMTRDKKPGYCENCRLKFDDLNAHAQTSRHRRFAQDDRNFTEIDGLIRCVRRSPRHQSLVH